MAEIYTPFMPGETDSAFAKAVAKAGAPVSNPAAYGTVPAPPPPPRQTAGDATAAAMGLGNAVYNQLPGYNASLGNIGANIQSETAGQLPADVVRQLSQQGAERGIAIGSPGSGNSDASLLQALGLTSLNLTNMGQQNLEGILPTLPGAGIYQNPNFYVTPGQSYDASLERNTLAAAPDPTAAAMANLAAARGGVSAGLGTGAVRLPPTPASGNTPAAPAAPLPADPSTAGTYYNGTWYPAGQAPTPIDQILAQYANPGQFPPDYNTSGGDNPDENY